MMLVGVLSSAFLLHAPQVLGLPWVWSGLTLFMGLRMETGFFRIMSKNGPWWFLHADLENTQANLISDQSGTNRRTLSLIMANNTALDDLFSVRWWETLRRQRLQSVKI